MSASSDHHFLFILLYLGNCTLIHRDKEGVWYTARSDHETSSRLNKTLLCSSACGGTLYSLPVANLWPTEKFLNSCFDCKPLHDGVTPVYC